MQIPDRTCEEIKLRKATEGTSMSAVGLEPGFRDPKFYCIQETRLGMQTLQERTHFRAHMSTQGCTHSQHSFPFETTEPVCQRVSGTSGGGEEGDREIERTWARHCLWVRVSAGHTLWGRLRKFRGFKMLELPWDSEGASHRHRVPRSGLWVPPR